MKLDNFISETLKQIIKGVVEAQEYGHTQNANINPITTRFNGGAEGQLICRKTGMPLQKIGFDIAVTVTEELTSANDGESVGSISVTSMNSTSSQNSLVSRIQFEVPVLLPATRDSKAD